MSEFDAELAFAGMKKKKKSKKKKLADFEDDLPSETSTSAPVSAAEAAAAGAGNTVDLAPVVEEEPLSATAKACLAASERVAPAVDEAFLSALLAGELDYSSMKKKAKRARPAGADDNDDLMDEFSLDKKKKKKKKSKKLDDLEDGEAVEEAAAGDADAEDRDYTYKEMLDRAFAIMRANNPELGVGEKKRFVMKPPQVVRLGSKKSGFANFLDICKLLHRQPDHLLAFMMAELGTSGSLDSSNCLVIKGRFSQKNIESVLRKYIRDYVTCHTCKSPQTILAKYNRLYFLQCETCNSRCSVASIKSGFQAVTGRRSRIRAAAAASGQ